MDSSRRTHGRRRIAHLSPLILGLALVAPAAQLAVPAAAHAQPERVVRFLFTPTQRVQLALWLERPDGTFVQTIRLTESVSYRGIANRPGALQMNSGFRWPYGRREGALPVWAHARASAGELFPRVIFQNRSSEGFASRTSNDASRDDYFCLSFTASTTRRDALDAVTCASVFNSDKGRYLTADDEAAGYAEPFEAEDGTATMRQLHVGSLYPPRRDVVRCAAAGCSDHPDVALFADDARAVMPDIDAVTMATPMGDEPQSIQLTVPPEMPNGDYVALLEVNQEGDYNDVYNDITNPTPEQPTGAWDYWAITYGYAYRGQPSVVYRVPFTLEPAGGRYGTTTPAGYGSLQGEDGEIHGMDGSITDDPAMAEGSGADRLRIREADERFTVEVVPSNVCDSPAPPPECGADCGPGAPCPDGFICSEGLECVGICDVRMPPGDISVMAMDVFPDVKESHHYARLSFVVPTSPRPIARYEVRYSTRPIDAASFERALPAKAAMIDSVELAVPVDGEPGTTVTVDVGGLMPQTRHYFAMRAIDLCNVPGPIANAEITTTEIHFTTVSPCFVATAAHGTPMASEVRALRRLRDRHLRNSAPGRALVDAYYRVGPYAADLIRNSEPLRAVTRAVLRPWVELARLLDD